MLLHRNCRKCRFHTRFPGNPVVGRGGDVAAIDMVCELAQVAYIVITAVILAKERTIKVTGREQLKMIREKLNIMTSTNRKEFA